MTASNERLDAVHFTVLGQKLNTAARRLGLPVSATYLRQPPDRGLPRVIKRHGHEIPLVRIRPTDRRSEVLEDMVDGLVAIQPHLNDFGRAVARRQLHEALS